MRSSLKLNFKINQPKTHEQYWKSRNRELDFGIIQHQNHKKSNGKIKLSLDQFYEFLEYMDFVDLLLKYSISEQIS